MIKLLSKNNKIKNKMFNDKENKVNSSNDNQYENLRDTQNISMNELLFSDLNPIPENNSMNEFRQ